MLKKTALIFILLANVVLLAHAVLPHHHHKEQVCTKCRYYIDDDILPAPETPVHNHQHNNRATPDNCILKQAIIIPSTQDKLTKNSDHSSVHHHLYFYIHSGLAHLDAIPASTAVINLPELPSFISSLAASAIGLRAPPTV